MEREILIDTQEVQERRVAILEDKVLEEYYIERAGTQRQIGNVYKGRVVNIVPGIQAAFVDVGLEKNGFLHIDDVEASAVGAIESEEDEERPASQPRQQRNINELLREGQEVIVQVIKEPLGTKGVRLTTNLSLPGRFLVLLPNDKQIAISRRIAQPEERKRLRQLAQQVKLPENCGLIVRTAGEGCTEKQFMNDAQYLCNLWEMILRRAREAPVPALLHEELDLVLRTIRDSFSEDVAQIVVNSREEYKRVQAFVRQLVPGAQRDIKLYEGKVPIFEQWGVQKDIDRAFRRKVWLKCGGYIVIDETEAMVTIDVNSGRHTGSGDLEETVTRTNLEAADEIARQLRLRNIGGLVVIDFIDMRNKQNQREVLARLQAALKKDKAKNSILPISEFGLVEMTRQRVKESISDSVYDQCPYCKGRGAVKSIVSACIDVQRMLKSVLLNRPERDLRVEVHPLVAEGLREHIVVLQNLEQKYHARLTVCSRDKLHIEECNVYDHRTGKLLESTK
ncbi:MAG: Rne/Rng family ribonuclease [bacterium]|nr:Rne/Rng family ribonuclease [bacterium]